MRDKKIAVLVSRFDKRRYVYSYLAIALYLFLNNTITASSVWMERNRDGVAEISIWEPYLWEYSSAISVLLLMPFLFFFFRRYPLRFESIRQQVIVHLCATVIFSMAHVILMVAMRELAYFLMGGDYQFGPWLREFWYEYRKDAWGYLLWLVAFQVGTSFYRRIKGDASLVDEQEEYEKDSDKQNADAKTPEFFLVKKLDKEFLVKVADIEWLESAGNYVNLHKEGRVYPLRGTLKETAERLSHVGFSRIHRGYAVNLDAIDNIEYQASGDGKITLKTGEVLSLSRRYKEEFKRSLG